MGSDGEGCMVDPGERDLPEPRPACGRCECVCGERSTDEHTGADHAEDVTAPVRDAARALARAESELDHAVHAARAQGATWIQIAEATGMSRGWAHERWSPDGRRGPAGPGEPRGRGRGGRGRGRGLDGGRGIPGGDAGPAGHQPPPT